MAAVHDAARSGARAPIEIWLFGSCSVRVGDQAPASLRSGKAEWLLGLLALRGGRGLSRAWVAETLWPGAPPERALFYLRRELTAIRQALGREAWRVQAPSPRTIQLSLDGAWIDLVEFDTAVARGDEASRERAVAIYRGELLEGCLEEWLLPERDQRRSAYLAALDQLAAAARARSDPTTAARLLRQLTATDPLRESAYRGLMEALSEAGDHAAVLQVYRDLRLLLHRELNASPAAETEACFERLRKTAQPPPAPGRAVGRSPRRLTPPRHNLPLLLTSFVGRERERAELRELVAAARLVTLTGSGGCGKTRLALRVASDLVEQQPDGVWLAEFAALSDPALVVPVVARTLGVRDVSGQAVDAALAASLRDRELLLLLDNCEHLLEPCASLCHQLLARAPGLRILATSRGPLGVPGEVVRRVAPLPTPNLAGAPGDETAGKVLAQSLLDNAAVRLFCDRARLVRADFRLTPQNARAVAEICHALDGIPLALELAAARIRGVSVSSLAKLLSDAVGTRLRLLVSEERTRPARQQTMRAAIDWSFTLLSEPERQFLAALSVFRDGWTLDAAVAVAGLPQLDVLDRLTALVDRSLVQYEESAGEGRYRLLESVREYACERLAESGEDEVAAARHARNYLELAGALKSGLESDGGKESLDRLEAEQGNFRAALDRLLHHDVEAGLQLALALCPLWLHRGYFAEGQTWLERALAQATGAPAAVRGEALLGLSAMALRQGQYEQAEAAAEEAWASYRQLDNHAGVSEALSTLAQVASFRGDREGARRRFEEALALQRVLDDPRGMGRTLCSLGRIALVLGEDERACALLEEALEAANRSGDPQVHRDSLCNLALVAISQGDYPTARPLLEEALRVTRATGARWSIAWCLHALGRLALARGEAALAGALLEESRATWEETGDPYGIAWAAIGLGLAAHALDDQKAAGRWLRESLRIRPRSGAPEGVVYSFEGLARVAASEGRAERAARLLGTVEACLNRSGAVRLPFLHRAQLDSQRAALRTRLGDESFERCFAAGKAMTPEQAVDYALEDAASQEKASPSTPTQ